MNARMPTLFIGHGSPLLAIEANDYAGGWRTLGSLLPGPRAILAISAHWYTHGSAVTAMQLPRTIHDFYGFPPALYACQYPAPGAPELASHVQSLLAPDVVHADHEWGLDHGTWSVLLHMYPQAKIPVLQLSINADLPPARHYALGQRLAPLRDQGVLLLGSGNVVHNLRRMQRQPHAAALPWASEFNAIVREAVLRHDHASLMDYQRHGVAARESVPTPEHYLPLLYVLGARSDGESVSIPIDGIDMGAISMMSVLIGSH